MFLPTSFLRRHWAFSGPVRSGRGSRSAWTSGRGASMQAWWLMPRRKGLPERAGPPLVARRRTKPWPGAFMTQCSWGSSVRTSIGKPTGRGYGVSSQTTSALKTGNRLQISSGRSTRTCGSTPWKTQRAQPSRSMRKYPKCYPLTSRRMTSHGSHKSSPAHQVRWEQRQWSCAIGSFASDVCQRS